MQLAFCLYKYFPYGGLQRDFLRIARECQSRGHAIRVYALEWTGVVPDGFELVRVPVGAFWNHRRYARFTEWVGNDLTRRPVDRVVGFNKMPGLDAYYAADPCFEHKARTLRKPLYRLSPRYRHFSAYERAVFGPQSTTRLMMISDVQMELFIRYYGTPRERFFLLPPGIAPDRRAPPDADAIRSAFRAEFGLGAEDLLLVQIGSDFPRKGLDRSIRALAALPAALRRRTRLIALGADDATRFNALATSLGVAAQVSIPGGRDDVPRFLLGADVLMHPARHENTGTVLLEALVAGLPVLATETCGYSSHIRDADAGCVVPDPFDQGVLDRMLADMLGDDAARSHWRRNALDYAEHTDLYSMPERAADIILQDGAE